MTVRIENHDQCSGTGRIPNDNAGEHRFCHACSGYGVLRADGGSYKSEQNALSARSPRTCYICQGKGYQIVADDRPCYGGGCTDGKVVVEAHVGDALPAKIDRTDTIPKPVAAMIAAELDIVVGAQNRGSTWNEAHLGLGSLWSTTDYGRTWDRLVDAAKRDQVDPPVEPRPSELSLTVDSIRQDIREKIATESTQWIKLIDRETRVIVDRVAVMVHRGGYTVVSQPSVDSGNHAMLPPTYTPELLNREVQ